MRPTINESLGLLAGVANEFQVGFSRGLVSDWIAPCEGGDLLTVPRLVKRSAIVGRLFYHTACCVLAKLHPIESEFNEGMVAAQQSHAQDICGIVAHVKDRCVSSLGLHPG